MNVLSPAEPAFTAPPLGGALPPTLGRRPVAKDIRGDVEAILGAFQGRGGKRMQTAYLLGPAGRSETTEFVRVDETDAPCPLVPPACARYFIRSGRRFHPREETRIYLVTADAAGRLARIVKSAPCTAVRFSALLAVEEPVPTPVGHTRSGGHYGVLGKPLGDLSETTLGHLGDNTEGPETMPLPALSELPPSIYGQILRFQNGERWNHALVFRTEPGGQFPSGLSLPGGCEFRPKDEYGRVDPHWVVPGSRRIRHVITVLSRSLPGGGEHNRRVVAGLVRFRGWERRRDGGRAVMRGPCLRSLTLEYVHRGRVEDPQLAADPENDRLYLVRMGSGVSPKTLRPVFRVLADHQGIGYRVLGQASEREREEMEVRLAEVPDVLPGVPDALCEVPLGFVPRHRALYYPKPGHPREGRGGSSRHRKMIEQVRAERGLEWRRERVGFWTAREGRLHLFLTPLGTEVSECWQLWATRHGERVERRAHASSLTHMMEILLKADEGMVAVIEDEPAAPLAA